MHLAAAATGPNERTERAVKYYATRELRPREIYVWPSHTLFIITANHLIIAAGKESNEPPGDGEEMSEKATGTDWESEYGVCRGE